MIVRYTTMREDGTEVTHLVRGVSAVLPTPLSAPLWGILLLDDQGHVLDRLDGSTRLDLEYA